MILLWTILILIFVASSVVGDFCQGLTGAGLAECRSLGDDVYAIVGLAFFVVWLLGTLVLLATRPGGGIRGFIVRISSSTRSR